jgi:UDP-N-acetylmuramoylalanine--D-glutamate ligase
MPLGRALRREDVRKVILFGENKEKIKKAIGDATAVKVTTSLERAVRAALKEAKPSEVVIFSPGATSFDMFDNYRERGKEFDRVVRNLK